ncbi:Crp/Fnr family transcriptional regulator [Glycomyces sp. A-F 0318]|uniref:Crp/Fnr family transcriptional regulator n=1 Tax=Glycomyces amatae TaxID=2881355 RepID=UPI001E5C73EB|nr:Crp/Fnr family transcriptional regulator [Glycomyces amatae]MCD0445991.1 Crp/Fnr family transcriptional regulator [Glycomyces amatae]
MEHTTADWGELLTDEEFTELAEQGHRVAYPAGTVVIRQGEVSDFVLYILKGHTKAVLQPNSETVEFHGPGQLVGEFSSLTGTPRSADVHAVTGVEALLVPGQVWRDFIATHARSACAHYSALARRLLEQDSASGLSYTSSERRVAKAVLKLIEAGLGVATDDGIAIRGFNQREIASIAKVSRESAAAVLRQLREAGVVSTARALVTVHDLAALERFADRDKVPYQRKEQ